MIDKYIVMELAEQCGFGGMSRPQLYPRLQKFAELVAKWENRHCIDECNSLGNQFSQADNEFADGKMDGAFSCAALLERRWL